MPFHEYISTKFGATIVLWQLTENEQTITTLLSEKERNLIDSQNLSPKRFCERAASRLSLNRIKETLNDDITYTAEGKPHLLRKSGHISISHTKEWVAVAYHPFLPIGIDIERIGEKIEKVAPRVFNAPELNISSENREKWLHICWSAKEALLKAIPETGIDFREHLHIVPTPLTEEGYLSAWETRTEATKIYTIWYRIYNDFVLVCTVPLQ